MISTESLPKLHQHSSPFLSESQRQWLEKAQAFADAIPLSDRIKSDVENVFRRDLFESACKEGFGALPFPTTYGGSGGDYLSFCLVNEEFGRKCVPVMSSLGVHVLCQEPVYKFGTEAQKERYLRPSSSGKFLAAFGLTEPGAGSDTAALATTARLNGSHYLLNGTKTFITSGGSADYYIVMARLQDPSAAVSEKTITAFIVERGFPGFEIGQKFDMLGMRGYSTCEIVFNDCQVPLENLLGEHGWGRKVALGSLAKGRVTIAAQATGWAQGAIDAAAAHLHSLPEHSADYHASVAQIGELAILTESARVLMHQAAYAIDRKDPDAVTLASMAKIQATDIAMRAATEAISIMGLAGMRREHLVERIFRDAKAGQIYEGTNQIQRMLIARKLTKES